MLGMSLRREQCNREGASAKSDSKGTKEGTPTTVTCREGIPVSGWLGDATEEVEVNPGRPPKSRRERGIFSGPKSQKDAG